MKRAISSAIVVTLALLVMLVIAAPAGARVFGMVGRTTVTGCNADVPVRFEVHFANGKPKLVDVFRAKDFGYPNQTPPVPRGRPRGSCIPGYDGWSYFNFRDPQGGYTTEVRFGTGAQEENEFGRTYQQYLGNTLLNQHTIHGFVNVERRAGEFHVKSHGMFLDAVSEGGLEYGGSSTGVVTWKAHDVRQFPR